VFLLTVSQRVQIHFNYRQCTYFVFILQCQIPNCLKITGSSVILIVFQLSPLWNQLLYCNRFLPLLYINEVPEQLYFCQSLHSQTFMQSMQLYQCRVNLYISCRRLTLSCHFTGADPGFKVRGAALKKIAPSGGRRENCWGILCKKSRFYAKKSYFFPILGGGGGRRGAPPLDPPLF
jgi:hypothetical protein